MYRLTAIVLAALALASCDKFNTEEANIVAYNVSGNPVEFYVNDGVGHRVEANSTARFTVLIDVATRRVSDTSPSYTVDKVVQVSVAAKNLGTGKLTQPRLCSAGAKVITHVSYEMYPGGYDYIRCDATYPTEENPTERYVRDKRRELK